MAEARATLTATLPRPRSRLDPDPWRRAWAYREAVLVFVVLLVAWELVARYVATAPNSLLPGPAKVLVALRDALPELWRGTIASLLILVPGFGLAAVLGVVLGLRVGTSERLRRAFLPFVRVAAPVPPTVYIPYAIAVLPTFRTSAIFVVFIGAFWPIFINAVSGAHSLDARYRDNARILGLGAWAYHRQVVFPASLPHIFSGMGVGLGFSFILLTVAELFGANAGLGRFVQYYADFADYPKMVAGILYTGLVTFLAMTLLDVARKRALFWLR
jgi:NitT/TauT family transport system permease protein